MRFTTALARTAQSAIIASLIVGLMSGPVFAGSNGGHGKPGGGGSCIRNTPGVAVDNTWSWSGRGSWGLPAQQLTYAINVINYDVGCGSSSFVVSLAAPEGFSVSIPATSITLKSSSSAYLWAYVSSPSAAVDGDYPLTVSVVRGGTSSPTGSFTTYYKVYSSDSVVPTLFWPNPGDGSTISGRSYTIAVSSMDDHAVQKIDLSIDNAYAATSACDNVSDSCQLYYPWTPVRGQHTATFTSYDWMGNVGVLTVTFTVS